MKLFLGLIFLVTTAVIAEEQPAFLKDATIVVTLKTGKQYAFNANQWKVVPRVVKVKSEDTKQSVASEQLNRVRILGGVGPKDFEVSTSSTQVTVKSKRKGVVGFGYDRKITKRFSLGGEVISNGTYTFGLGVDF